MRVKRGQNVKGSQWGLLLALHTAQLWSEEPHCLSKACQTINKWKQWVFCQWCSHDSTLEKCLSWKPTLLANSIFLCHGKSNFMLIKAAFLLAINKSCVLLWRENHSWLFRDALLLQNPQRQDHKWNQLSFTGYDSVRTVLSNWF